MIILHFKVHMLEFNRRGFLCYKQKQPIKPSMMVASYFQSFPSTRNNEDTKETKTHTITRGHLEKWS